ncbi:ADL249Wp [Eremothecium gossypii ATCC 10895]|uniref:histidinol-phosphate transaminase n=1 Tax=Eremothecium gossypii (strain ATCC 10895 / CBS 109.51 / FGSC 9923 / NRRL Y-1056) TaxID=284811 RepID=Q75B26_EREGS|nr:ADL249Wp [Eremothecium gossypii ATCC 10895]AAS51671.1 ADL249Wp [Eremothecium gossypii ATCC 10895]
MDFDIKAVIRPNILKLKPYRCARDDFSEGILLDANENAFGPVVKFSRLPASLHRYPDPHQLELKGLLASYRNAASAFREEGLAPLTAKNICLGVGSDESIDAIIRATCSPREQKVMLLPPTYGMYKVCADINDVGYVEVPLISSDNSFQIDEDRILEQLNLDKSIKVVFITSPGNPTGACIEVGRVEKLLRNWTAGIVVVDEAYIDFSADKPSLSPLVNKHPNLVVLQTLSKASGLAGIRLGFTFASTQIATALNAMKAPYNISQITAIIGIEALQPEALKLMQKHIDQINTEKRRIIKALATLNHIENDPVGGLDANFILFRVRGGDNSLAKKLYYSLATESGVIIRFRGTDLGCEGCIRITVGTPEENDVLIKEFTEKLQQLTED